MLLTYHTSCAIVSFFGCSRKQFWVAQISFLVVAGNSFWCYLLIYHTSCAVVSVFWLRWEIVFGCTVSKKDSYSVIRNGLMPHLWGINLSHIYAREVRWNFEFNNWYSSKICSCLSKKTWHSLHLLFFEMSTLKGDVRVKLFYFTKKKNWPYVKIGESCIEFVCRNVIF